MKKNGRDRPLYVITPILSAKVVIILIFSCLTCKTRCSPSRSDINNRVVKTRPFRVVASRNTSTEPVSCRSGISGMGGGLGSLFVIRDTDKPETQETAEENLTEFRVLWEDSVLF